MKNKNNKKFIVAITIAAIIIILLALRSCSSKKVDAEVAVGNAAKQGEVIVQEVNEEVKEEIKDEVIEEETDETELYYWVNYFNIDGSILQRSAVKCGNMPSYIGETPTYNDDPKYIFIGWDKEEEIVHGTQNYTAEYFLYSPHSKQEVVEADDDDCVLAGTNIMLADGTTKKVEDLTLDDMLMTFNFHTGKLSGRKPSTITKHIGDNIEALYITLDNGQELGICDLQSFFDMDLKGYFDISADEYADAIGRNIMYVENGKVSAAKIVDIKYEEKVMDSYEISTDYDKNFIADGFLTIEPEIWANIYTINDGLKIDADILKADIEKYGLYTYDEFKDIMSFNDFNRFNVAITKVAVNKGLVSGKDMKKIYKDYMSWLVSNNYYIVD